MKGKCFSTIHFFTETPNFTVELRKILQYEDLNKRRLCQGVQLNLNKPNFLEILRFKREFPELSTILQLNQTLLSKEKGHSPHDIRRHYRMVEYLLIDGSRGTGKPANLEFGVKTYQKFREFGMINGVGFAGGFSPANVSNYIQNYATLLNTTNFSIDVESGVRTLNKYDLKKVGLYLQQVTDTFKELEPNITN